MIYTTIIKFMRITSNSTGNRKKTRTKTKNEFPKEYVEIQACISLYWGKWWPHTNNG